jgi:UDP-N-acetyl-D-mannosaminuronic acid transferase (WecB/TagA/CpsF family)
MATYERVDYGSPDGAQLGGASTDKIAFYGVTPVVQPTAAAQAAPASTDAVSVSATQWGFSTSAQANAVIDCLIEIRTALVNLGLIKGS